MALIRRLALTAALVGGAGFLAIGGAGLIGGILLAAKGDAFLTAPWGPGTYTRADCARWLAGYPGSHSCVAAMLSDPAAEFLLQAAAAGLFGLIAIAAYLVLRGRWRDRDTLTVLPAGTAEALGTVLAGLAAVGLLGRAVNAEMVQRGIGAGEPWSLGTAAAVAAVAFALALAPRPPPDRAGLSISARPGAWSFGRAAAASACRVLCWRRRWVRCCSASARSRSARPVRQCPVPAFRRSRP